VARWGKPLLPNPAQRGRSSRAAAPSGNQGIERVDAGVLGAAVQRLVLEGLQKRGLAVGVDEEVPRRDAIHLAAFAPAVAAQAVVQSFISSMEITGPFGALGCEIMGVRRIRLRRLPPSSCNPTMPEELHVRSPSPAQDILTRDGG